MADEKTGMQRRESRRGRPPGIDISGVAACWGAFSRTEIAVLTGVPESTLRDYDKGKAGLPLAKLAEFIGSFDSQPLVRDRVRRYIDVRRNYVDEELDASLGCLFGGSSNQEKAHVAQEMRGRANAVERQAEAAAVEARWARADQQQAQDSLGSEQWHASIHYDIKGTIAAKLEWAEYNEKLSSKLTEAAYALRLAAADLDRVLT